MGDTAPSEGNVPTLQLRGLTLSSACAPSYAGSKDTHHATNVSLSTLTPFAPPSHPLAMRTGVELSRLLPPGGTGGASSDGASLVTAVGSDGAVSPGPERATGGAGVAAVSGTPSRTRPPSSRPKTAAYTPVRDAVFDVTDDGFGVDEVDAEGKAGEEGRGEDASTGAAGGPQAAGSSTAAGTAPRRRLLGLTYMALSAVLFSVMSLIGSM
jgi:hypothetical protein